MCALRTTRTSAPSESGSPAPAARTATSSTGRCPTAAPDDPSALTAALQDLDDPPIRRVLDEAGRTLGGVLADLVSLLNPAALILGGELGTAGPSFVAGVRAEVDHRALAASADLEIRTAELGTRAELIGAVMHAAASIRQ